MESESNGSGRKTLDQRAQMTDLERLRHSCAHVMATAIVRLWPDAQFAARPAGRERVLLRRRAGAPHYPGRFPGDRGGDEEGDQGQPRLREGRGHRASRRRGCPERAAGRPDERAGIPASSSSTSSRASPKASRSPISRTATSSISAPDRT